MKKRKEVDQKEAETKEKEKMILNSEEENLKNEKKSLNERKESLEEEEEDLNKKQKEQKEIIEEIAPILEQEQEQIQEKTKKRRRRRKKKVEEIELPLADVLKGSFNILAMIDPVWQLTDEEAQNLGEATDLFLSKHSIFLKEHMIDFYFFGTLIYIITPRLLITLKNRKSKKKNENTNTE